MKEIITLPDSSIADYVNVLLEQTEQINDNPVIFDSIHDILGITQKDFDLKKIYNEVEKGEQIPIRGILDLNEKIIALDENELNRDRKNFSNAHEIGHYILPNHRDELFRCNERDMSYSTHLFLEMEANRFASNLIFKGSIFEKMMKSFTVADFNSISTIADKFSSSFTSAARRFVELNKNPVALVIVSINNGVPTLEYTITSKLFRNQYFSAISKISNLDQIFNSSKNSKATDPYLEKLKVILAQDKKTDFNSSWYRTRQYLFGLFTPTK